MGPAGAPTLVMAVHEQGMERQIHCLDVHPAQPYACASGSSQGSVALWDLRSLQGPIVATLNSPDAGNVWEVSLCIVNYNLDSAARQNSRYYHCARRR